MILRLAALSALVLAPALPSVVASARAPSAFGLSLPLTQGALAIGTAPPGTVQLTLDGTPVAFAEDRRFLVAFDRDAGPVAVLSARLGDGREIREQLQVAPRAWNLSRLDRLPKYPVPQPEFERVRPSELARIQAARALQTNAQGWRQPFSWPTTGRISTLFGSQRIYAGEPGAFHSGIDIARATGTPVLAPADGVVILAADQPFTLEGHLLMIDHGMGLNSALLHLSRIDVKPGDQVRRGQPIGAVGRSGRATGPHLHWGLRWHDARIDPLLVAGSMPAQ
ncbi:M23 family metallopeptidase [Sphingomonas sp. S2-65]|uniref:M23 family metallopeptidase n=1 Tax=Sphingomonas sp. S2-65 TaxID=2903960 RepID=UPI001F32F0F9|nr:M23 family metallopeptidase [Sphingomonas sp. S2-65]UYY57636.1 M23 family metallopeptidase [Sphingomonas sp. S2-65]